jgi:hypothetical protein
VGPGATIERYQLLRPLGSGGSGTVFEAVDASIGRRVALKIMLPRAGAASARRAAARFLREGRIASQIRHPHVVDVFDVGIDDGTPFLVMELVEGETLAALVAREHMLSVARAVEIALPIVSATAELHASGVIHRDIKPANVLLPSGPSVCPKLADFGASWCDDDSAPITRPGSLVGTPEYLAPELIRFGKRATERSDQYALGVLLYECVTGERPFDGDTTYERLHAAVSAELVPPSWRSPSVSPAFDAVVLRAMHRDPLKRYPSMAALGQALLPFVAAPIAARWRGGFVRDLGEAAAPASGTRRPPAVRETEEGAVHLDDGVAVVVRGDLFCTVWREPARVQRIRSTFDMLDELIARQPAGVVILMVVLPTADPPDKAAREENDRRLRLFGPNVRTFSTVVVGDALRQVLIRGVIRAMVLPHQSTLLRSTLDATLDGGIRNVMASASPRTPAPDVIHEDLCAMHAALGVAVPARPSGPAGRPSRPVRQSA